MELKNLDLRFWDKKAKCYRKPSKGDYKVEIDKNQTFMAVLTPLNNTSAKGGLSTTLLADYCEVVGNIHDDNPADNKMSLDEAIEHAKEQSIKAEKEGNNACAREHNQLAEWLSELKRSKEEAK